MKKKAIVLGLMLVVSSLGLWQSQAASGCQGPSFVYFDSPGNLASAQWSPTSNFTTARCVLNPPVSASCNPSTWVWGTANPNVVLQGSGLGPSAACVWACQCTKSAISYTFSVTLDTSNGLPVELLELSID